MKKTLIFALNLVIAASSFGAVYTINGGTGSTATGITDSSSRAFRGASNVGDALGGTNGGLSGGPGVIAVGLFSSTFDFVNSTASQIRDGFTNLSTGSTSSFAAAGGPSARGQYSFGLPNVNVRNNSTFQDQPMYLLVGNGSSFLNSTEFLILRNSRNFLAVDDDVATGVTVSFTSGTSTLMFGTAASDVRTTGADTSITAGFRTAVPVPEASTSLLGAIGALALLRRRRN